MRRPTLSELFLPVFFIVYAVYLLNEIMAGNYQTMSVFYTQILAAAVMLLGVIQLIRLFRSSPELKSGATEGAVEAVAPVEDIPGQSGKKPIITMMAFTGLTIAVILGFERLGHLISFTLFLLVAFWLLRIRSIPRLLTLTMCSVAFIHVVFVELLGLDLPAGILEKVLKG